MEGKNGTLSVKLASVDVSTMRRPKYYKLRQNRAVMLEVGDNGCGIEDQHLEKIFDPFYTTKGVGEGTGLGLTEVAGIVKSLNGAIDIETEPTKGTRFKVFLPVQNAA
jgi:signal transduction histidine kinase